MTIIIMTIIVMTIIITRKKEGLVPKLGHDHDGEGLDEAVEEVEGDGARFGFVVRHSGNVEVSGLVVEPGVVVEAGFVVEPGVVVAEQRPVDRSVHLGLRLKL